MNGDCSLEIKRPWSLENCNDRLRQHVKKQRHYFANKGQYSQSYHFSSSHVQMWELDSKKDWVLKNSYFWTVVLKKTVKSPLDSKEIKPVNPKGNQHWIFIGRTDARAQYSVHLMQRADSLKKTLMLGKTEGRRRRGLQRIRCLDSITESMDMNLSKFQKIMEDRGACLAAVHGVTKSQTQLKQQQK